MRGFGILCVTVIHFFSFKSFFYQPLYWPPALRALRIYGGSTFIFWAGLCATLFSERNGAKPGKFAVKGLKLLGIGFVLTGLSFWLRLSGRETGTVLIQWGVLHCIGTCLLLYPLVRRFPVWLKYVLGASIAAAGYYVMSRVRVEVPWLFPLGFRTESFRYFDWFPMMPHFGWFLAGSGTGTLVYGRNGWQTLFPGANAENPVIRFFTFLGRNSLTVYLVGMIGFYILFSSL